MTDRELLEFAAKAAGLDVRWIAECQDYYEHRPHMPPGYWDKWNPLTSDADALRLAVKLKMTITYVANETWPDVIAITGHQITEQVGSNPYAATRRAIVRAAAEIGRNMT